jgi:hypothetical protein
MGKPAKPKAKPRTKASKARLPLVSGNWWPLPKTVSYIEAQTGDRYRAAHDFLVAVNDGQLPIKVDHLNLRTKVRTTVVLTPELLRRYKLARWQRAWVIGPRATEPWTSNPKTNEEVERNRRIAAEYPLILPSSVLFFWAPRLKQARRSSPGNSRNMPAGARRLIAPSC